MCNVVMHVATVDSTVRFLLLPFLLNLQKRGYQVSAACKTETWRSDIERENISLHNIQNFTRHITPIHDIFALWELFGLFRRVKPTIVHTHTPKANFLGRTAARLAGVPIVIGMEHGFYFWNMTGPERAFHIALCRFSALISDKTIVINRHDFDLALRERIIEKNKLVLFPSGLGVNPDRFKKIEANNTSLKSELNMGEDVVVVAFIGRLNVEKGCRELIQAMGQVHADFPNIYLLFIGPSEDRMKEELEKLVLMMNIKNKVRFLGERDDIPQLLAISDMLVLPSYREGLGMVLLEAAAAGKPVVTTNIRGCRDVVIHGETGLLVPPRAVEELADAILDLLRDADKRKRMGDAARQRIAEKFDQNLFFAQTNNLYDQLLKEKGIR